MAKRRKHSPRHRPHHKKHSPHSLEWERVVRDFHSDAAKGLTEEEAKERLRSAKNILPEEKPPSNFIILLRQFKNPLIFILLIAGLVTLALGEHTDSVVILSAVLLNAIVGYVQENKATKSLYALKKILHKRALVIREETEKEISQINVVRGDIIVLESGNSVPADARIIESWELHVNESVLTGEWIVASKHADVLDEKTTLADRDNMVHMGSVIEQGKAKAIVTATGTHTEIGKIAELIQSVKDEKTPYQRKIDKLSWKIGIAVAFISVLIFAQGTLLGKDAIEMFTVAVAVAVAAIPEGLPIAITIILAIGMQRILQKRGLVRRLAAAETLGNTSVIVTDKTLTLTEGKMAVEEIYTPIETDREEAIRAATLANEAFVENPDAVFEDWIVRGRPTDKALMRAGMDAGISKITLEEEMPLVFRIPFDSEQKYIASFHRKGRRSSQTRLYLSGAPERIIELCRSTKREKGGYTKTLHELTERGLRVVAVASRDITLSSEARQAPSTKESERIVIQELRDKIEHVKFIGFIALIDPLRKDVKAAISFARKAGMRVIIATGDHFLTARAVAKELGMKTNKENIMEGKELEELTDEQLDKRLDDISVYARVEPAHKMRIIQAWQARDEVIAMTGDGVNDAPALKRADIGLALGSGTDVAKETADLILLGDNFSIIPSAIKEGRVIVDNIRKVVTYFLSGSLTEIMLISVALLLRLPFLPVTALQILWINLIEDGLPGAALTMEKAEADVMDRKPQKKNSPLLTNEMKVIILLIGFITDLLLLGLFLYLLNYTSYTKEHIQTVIFIGLGIGSLLYIFSCKSLRRNIWSYNPFSNPYLNISVLGGFFFMFVAVYIAPFSTFMKTAPLSLVDWIVVFGLGLLNLFLIEMAKWYYIRKKEAL